MLRRIYQNIGGDHVGVGIILQRVWIVVDNFIAFIFSLSVFSIRYARQSGSITSGTGKDSDGVQISMNPAVSYWTSLDCPHWCS